MYIEIHIDDIFQNDQINVFMLALYYIRYHHSSVLTVKNNLLFLGLGHLANFDAILLLF